MMKNNFAIVQICWYISIINYSFVWGNVYVVLECKLLQIKVNAPEIIMLYLQSDPMNDTFWNFAGLVEF